MKLRPLRQFFNSRYEQQENRVRNLELQRNEEHEALLVHRENEKLARMAAEAAEQGRATLEAVLQAVGDGIVVVDERGTFVFANRASAKMLGFPSSDDLLQDYSYFVDRFELFNYDGLKVPIEQWPLARIVRGETFSDMQFRTRLRDTGKEWDLNFSGVVVKDTRGNPTLRIIITRDVTAEKLAEARLKEAVRARDEFLSLASHELKTPLTSLKLQTQLRQKDLKEGRTEAFSPERLAKLFDGYERMTDRLTRLINDMLDISRITSGRLAIKFEEFDLVEIIKQVTEQVQPLSSGSLELSQMDSVIGSWDRHRIEQVVSNLLNNALKYGEGRPIKVSLRYLNERYRPSALITVQDQGRGISREDQTRIFEKFERVSTKGDPGGLGLGLFIAKQIVELHHGSIRVESELGKGSTFFVELPVENGTSP